LASEETWEPAEFSIDPARPLYEQFAEHIRFEIAKGNLKPRTRLPSVRDLAAKFRANPNTVMRAYQELERERLIITYRGQGTFVTDDEDAIFESKRHIAIAAYQQLCIVAEAIGVSVEQLIQLAKAGSRDGR
jgi:GntR family transcriptional regulator